MSCLNQKLNEHAELMFQMSAHNASLREVLSGLLSALRRDELGHYYPLTLDEQWIKYARGALEGK